MNRDKLQRAGKDNLFLKLLFGWEKPVVPKTLDEQERLGNPSVNHNYTCRTASVSDTVKHQWGQVHDVP